MEVNVKGIGYKVIKSCEMLYCGGGWGMDNEGWIVETEFGEKNVLSCYGRNHFADPAELKEQIDTYKKAIDESEAALKLMI